jgi:hypothetical protein
MCELVASSVGAGVSTEMRRLAERLQDGANLLPVIIDAEEVLDIYNPIDVSDIFIAILYKTDEAVLTAEGKNPKDALKEGVLARSWRWLATTEVEMAGVSEGKVRLDLKTMPSFRERVRSQVDAGLSRFISEVRDELTLLNHRASKLSRDGLVVLFDGLEKLTGITTNQPLVIDSAERIFASGAPWLSLPVHTVFTLPLALQPRLYRAVSVLPMIATTQREGQPRAEGFEAARQIVERRVPAPILDEIFGAEHRTERVDRLIAASGGSPRQIVRLLQSCVAESSLDEKLFVRLLSMQSDEFRRAISSREAPWLARVGASKVLDITEPWEREVAERMLLRGAILPYQNGEAWFDLHPAVRDAPAVTAVTEQERQP